MDEIRILISNKSLLGEDFYNNGNVCLTINKNEMDMILEIALRNNCEILIRNNE